MPDILGGLNIMEIILSGLASLNYVFDIIIILSLIPAIIGAAKRGIFKTLFRFLIYGTIFLVAFLNIEMIANYVGENFLKLIGQQISYTYEETIYTYDSFSGFFTALLEQGESSGATVEAVVLGLNKNLAWIIVFPVLTAGSYILTTVLWVIMMVFFPRALRKRIKELKLPLLNVPLGVLMSLVLILFSIAPYVNLSTALRNIVIDPESPVGFLSPSYAGILAWFTPAKSFILTFLQSFGLTNMFVFFDTIKVGGVDVNFAEELNRIINVVGAITPAP
ncbi:MAG TPA: hypothetical protein VJZ31_02790 [Bacilli bacterium]|nr:hypothetical protein [Bacilli bacterium]